jgi:hypothetical protein
VVLFGIGAGDEIAAKCNTLITKAVYVSSRDEPSLAALRRFRERMASFLIRCWSILAII